MAENEGKNLKKLLTKKGKARLNEKEKNRVCILLAEGYSQSEVAQIIAKESKKLVTPSQIKHYADSEKWIPKIIEARGRDIEKAMLIPITGLAFRSRQYQFMFDGVKERYEQYEENIKGYDLERFLPKRFLLLHGLLQDEGKQLLGILESAKKDMREARILQGPVESEDTELDFDEIVESITISRKRRKGQRDLAKKAGLIHD